MKSFLLVAIVAVLSLAAVAQVGGNDYTFAGGPFTIHKTDGTTWTYSIYYSPSSVTRNGDVVTVTYETITSGSPTNFYQNVINCTTQQYTFAKYDTSVSPAVLGDASEWKNIQPNTAGPALTAIVCK